MARQNITDRAKRYRAQANVTGPRKCVLCGARADLGVMHLTGNEDHGEKANLAYGCRSCNMKLAAAFKRVGAGRPTNQYNPSSGVPTFEQYAWAVSSGERDFYPNSTRHKAGAHDEAGAIIHATPKHKRIEYAKRIARSSQGTRRARSQESLDRWNPAYGEPSMRKGRPWWSGSMGGDYATKAEAVKAAKKYGLETGKAVRVWTTGPGHKHEMFEVVSDSQAGLFNPGMNATTEKHEKEIRAYIEAKISAGKTAEQIYRAVWRRWGYQGQAKDGAVHLKMHDGMQVFQVNGNPSGIGRAAGRKLAAELDAKHGGSVEYRGVAVQFSGKPRHYYLSFDPRVFKSMAAAHTAIDKLYETRSLENPWPFSRPDARRTTPATGGIAYHMAKKATAAGAGGSGGARRRAPAKKAPGGFSVPDESVIQDGFKRGLSLREILQQNPGMAKRYEGKFALYTDAGMVAFGVTKKRARDMAKRITKGSATVATSSGTPLEFYEKGKRRNPTWDGRPMTAAQRDASYAEEDRDRESAEKHAEWVRQQERKKLRNPASAAAEVFEEFHGFAPAEVITVTKQIHYHEHLAAAGKLTHLDVWGIDKQGHRIAGFKGAVLAFNEQKNQLFVEGGDQTVNLSDYGIRKAHELETLGQLTDIGYQTNKTHLGDEGGDAVYVHKFRSTNENGKHVVVKIARYPDLIYDVRNESLLFSGGSYEILAEGINK